MAPRHVHKYHRIELAFTKVWACALPDCNHYMPKHLENIVPGKASICWGCDEKMILNPTNMKQDQPLCDVCDSNANKISEALQNRLVG